MLREEKCERRWSNSVLWVAWLISCTSSEVKFQACNSFLEQCFPPFSQCYWKNLPYPSRVWSYKLTNLALKVPPLRQKSNSLASFIHTHIHLALLLYSCQQARAAQDSENSYPKLNTQKKIEGREQWSGFPSPTPMEGSQLIYLKWKYFSQLDSGTWLPLQDLLGIYSSLGVT